MQIRTMLKLAVFMSILYIGTNVLALGKGSSVNGGETVQNLHVDENYHRVKRNGPFERRLIRTKRLESPPSSQKLLVRAKRLNLLEAAAAKEANMARAKRFAKLVHAGSAGHLLVRTKRRDLVQPVINKHQLTRVKRLSFSDHHGGHHGKVDSHQTEKHHDGHHEAKRHHDGKAPIHNKENRNGRKESHAKKAMHLKKGSHDGESHSKMAKRHDVKQTHLKDSHLKKNLHASQHGKGHEKKDAHHMSKKSNGHKDKKEKRRLVHKVGGGYHNKKISGGHGVGHPGGHDNTLRNSRVSHQKWKRNAKRIATIANKLSYLKKSKKLSLKH